MLYVVVSFCVERIILNYLFCSAASTTSESFQATSRPGPPGNCQQLQQQREQQLHQQLKRLRPSCQHQLTDELRSYGSRISLRTLANHRWRQVAGRSSSETRTLWLSHSSSPCKLLFHINRFFPWFIQLLKPILKFICDLKKIQNYHNASRVPHSQNFPRKPWKYCTPFELHVRKCSHSFKLKIILCVTLYEFLRLLKCAVCWVYSINLILTLHCQFSDSQIFERTLLKFSSHLI